ncbi:protein trichome birefringence-like 34 [Ipomoea triloba]|uniref:protein trichome birefringence-like 34 n=1 Tax=Ipomoea triloba TaxID=35885 RepID=UPI00125D38AC|nr:protein trichome birefringence-like 34 [Ipomoea triloba]
MSNSERLMQVGRMMNNGVSFRFLSLVVIITAGLVITSLRISRETIAPKLEDDRKFKKTPLSSCNFYSGKWVFDKDFSPLYSSRSCSFMDDGMACGKYGRSNLDYMFWKWQPHDCELPRFDAISLLEKLRNKRVVFVGDSLNRNQWVSLVCLIESSIPDQSLKYVKFNGSLVTFEAIEYNAKIEFYWAPLLVESNCDDPSYHRVEDRIVRVDSIEKHARHWKDADVLVFNSYIWWRWMKMKVLRGSFESTNATYEDLGTLHTFELTLKTWSDWLDAHVNRTKTRVFFVSMSPTHSRAEEWGGRNGENCYNETEPISNPGYWGMDSDPDMMRLVEAAVHKLSSRGLNVEMLNITQLSEYRKEAHSSIYRKHWDPLTKEQLVNPGSYADCLHWCLPGVPDVWNQLLYVYLLYL